MKCLALYVTDLCNFSCKTCRTPDLTAISGDRRHYLDLELLKKNLPAFRTQGYGVACLTGGEACLHPRFADMVRHLYDHSWRMGVVSNGSMIEKYEFLLDYRDRLSFMCFSLDGATADVHDGIRQAGSYDKVVRAIQWAVGNKIHTRASFCLNKFNAHQVEAVIKLCIDLKVEDLNVCRACESGLGLNREVCLEEEERLAIAEAMPGLMEKYPEIWIRTFAAVSFGNGFCESATNLDALEINHRGELRFCVDAFCQGALVGSLYEESAHALYKKALVMSARLQSIRRRMIDKGLRFDGFDTCDFCNRVLNEPAFQWELRHEPD